MLFQFLMVRLKEPGVLPTTPLPGISIPYGSIKSHRSRHRPTDPRTFQFLMVRLKARAGCAAEQQPRDFNSLWFD